MSEKLTLPFVYRGRTVDTATVDYLRRLIAANPGMNRTALSKQVCLDWNWVQPNGALKDMVCRGMMLMLHRGGYIKLPVARKNRMNSVSRNSQSGASPLLLEETPLHSTLKSLMPLHFEQVRRTNKERLFNALIAKYHYLGYVQPVGEHLKYLFYSGETLLGGMVWSSPPWHLGPRDKLIGWSPDVRKKNIHLIACNSRFLILPWVKVDHLASHALAKMAKQLPKDWLSIYNHPIYYLETFVDTQRFAGTCYRAANWIHLGQTTGRWRRDKKQEKHCHIKAIWGYPLSKHFQYNLCHHQDKQCPKTTKPKPNQMTLF